MIPLFIEGGTGMNRLIAITAKGIVENLDKFTENVQGDVEASEMLLDETCTYTMVTALSPYEIIEAGEIHSVEVIFVYSSPM